MADIYNPATWHSATKQNPATDAIWEKRIAEEVMMNDLTVDISLIDEMIAGAEAMRDNVCDNTPGTAAYIQALKDYRAKTASD